MKAVTILGLASLALALPQTNPCSNLIPVGATGATSPANLALKRACTEAAGGQVKRQSIIEQLQATFDRDNPNGTPTAEGDPDDLNGDGVINAFEANAQAGKK